MAIESSLYGTPGTNVPDTFYYDEDSNSTAQDNITGSADDEIYIAEINAQDNPTEDVYTKVYASLDATAGSTTAEMVLMGVKGATTTYIFRNCAADTPAWAGVPIGTGLSVATVTEKGGGAGATSPTGTVKLKLGVKVV